MKKQKLGRYFVPNAKILEQKEGSTVFRVVGIPFGGPEWLGGKDLHGEFFDRKNTDLGRDTEGNIVVNTVYAYYDHALNDSIGRDRIGFAKFYEETDEGQVWDIEVQRAYRYHDMLLQLAQKDLLGASSQPVQTSVEIDWESGLIKQWHPVEISLTPTPANPNAKVVLKSFGVELPEDDADPDEEEENDEAAGDDLSEEIEEMFSDEDQPAGEEGAGEVVPATDIAKMFNDLITLVNSKFEVLDAEIKSLKTQQVQANKDLMTAQQQIKGALKTFAEQVAVRLKVKVQEIAEDQTEDEQEANRIAKRYRSVIPSGAPGTRREK